MRRKELEYKILVRKTENHTEYGICLTNSDAVVACIPEIAESKSKIEQLTALLNDLSVEPCHFENVVEDFLTDFEV